MIPINTGYPFPVRFFTVRIFTILIGIYVSGSLEAITQNPKPLFRKRDC